MSLIPIKLLCNRRPKSSSPSSGSGSGSSSSGTTTNSVATNDWFYMNTEENAVHCKYPLVGDSEVSAFGYGSSSGGGGGGGSIDPSVLADYVTKSELNAAGYLSNADMSNFVTESELNAAGYLSSADMRNYVTYSYLDSLDYETAITQLNANMSGLQRQVQSNKSYLTAYNTRISTLESNMSSYNNRITSLENNMNSYGSNIAAIEAYLPILAYMHLCHDKDNFAYIRFSCPIVAMGDIVAYGYSFSWQ